MAVQATSEAAGVSEKVLVNKIRHVPYSQCIRKLQESNTRSTFNQGIWATSKTRDSRSPISIHECGATDEKLEQYPRMLGITERTCSRRKLHETTKELLSRKEEGLRATTSTPELAFLLKFYTTAFEVFLHSAQVSSTTTTSLPRAQQLTPKPTMKLTFTTTIAAALALTTIGASSAADINVVGAKDTPTMTRSGDAVRTGIDIKIATADLLNKPTALINKNTLAMDNNIFISRSNLVFSQNDRIKMMKKVEAMVTSAIGTDMSSAVLSKDILKVVSGKDLDAATMTKASAVVAAKDDASTRGQRIADLVNTVFDMKTKESDEQSIQSEAPRGVTILIGTKDILRQPTGVVNKNIVVSDNQIAISGSTLAPSQNDVVALGGNAKVATAVAPASAIKVTMKGNEKDEMDGYRVGFLYNKEGTNADADKKGEQFWGGGLGFGWRYPLGYWNMCGAGLYGGGCGLGMPYGGFFYC